MRKVFSQVPHRYLYSPSTWAEDSTSEEDTGAHSPGTASLMDHPGNLQVHVLYVFLYYSYSV